MKNKLLLLLCFMIPMLFGTSFAKEGWVDIRSITVATAEEGMLLNCLGCQESFGEALFVGDNVNADGATSFKTIGAQYYIVGGNKYIAGYSDEIIETAIDSSKYQNLYNEAYKKPTYEDYEHYLKNGGSKKQEKQWRAEMASIQAARTKLAECNKFRKNFNLCNINEKNVWLNNMFVNLSDIAFSIENDDLVVLTNMCDYIYSVTDCAILPPALNLNLIVGEMRFTKENNCVLCANCAYCDKCKNEYVIVSRENEEVKNVSKGCENHACHFFVDTELTNGALGIYEGVVCLDIHPDGIDNYCSNHVCQSEGCLNPVIGSVEGYGENNTRSITFGDNQKLFTDYCYAHLCLHAGCFNQKTTVDQVGGSVANKKLVSNTCDEHSTTCINCGNQLDVSEYEIDFQPFCSMCRGGNICQYCGENPCKEGSDRCEECDHVLLRVFCHKCLKELHSEYVSGNPKADEEHHYNNEAGYTDYACDDCDEDSHVLLRVFCHKCLKELHSEYVSGNPYADEENHYNNEADYTDYACDDCDEDSHVLLRVFCHKCLKELHSEYVSGNPYADEENHYSNEAGYTDYVCEDCQNIKYCNIHQTEECLDGKSYCNKCEATKSVYYLKCTGCLNEQIDSIKYDGESKKEISEYTCDACKEKEEIESSIESNIGEIKNELTNNECSHSTKVYISRTATRHAWTCSDCGYNGNEKHSSGNCECGYMSNSGSTASGDGSITANGDGSGLRDESSSSKKDDEDENENEKESDSKDNKKECRHENYTIKYTSSKHYFVCGDCANKFSIEDHIFTSLGVCTKCGYTDTTIIDNRKTEEMKNVLGIKESKYDSFIKANLWAYDTVLALSKNELLISYPELDKIVDTNTYLTLLSKVVAKSGAYSALLNREYSKCATVAYPTIESSTPDYEFIMLAFGNAFGDEGKEQGKKMFEKFYFSKPEWISKAATRYEMLALSASLFTYTETDSDIDISTVPDRFVPYVKQAIRTGWYQPYSQDGKTATLNNLYLTDTVNIFNAYAMVENIYKTLTTDSIMFNGFLKNELVNEVHTLENGVCKVCGYIAEPLESTNPIEVTKPDESVKPNESEKMDESVKPNESEKTDESVKPDESEKFDESADFGKDEEEIVRDKDSGVDLEIPKPVSENIAENKVDTNVDKMDANLADVFGNVFVQKNNNENYFEFMENNEDTVKFVWNYTIEDIDMSTALVGSAEIVSQNQICYVRTSGDVEEVITMTFENNSLFVESNRRDSVMNDYLGEYVY